MAAKKHHPVLLIGGGLAGAAAAYEFLYKPWKLSHDAAAAAAAGGSGLLPYTPTGSGGGGFSFPYIATPSTITPSNLDPGAAIGGPIGSCMHKKGWTQSQCTDRLTALQSAYQGASARLKDLQSGGAVAEAQAAIAANQAALQVALAHYNADIAAGDAAGANQWKQAIDGHNADIRDLQARISTVATQIAAYQNAIAGYLHDYQALTGFQLAAA